MCAQVQGKDLPQSSKIHEDMDLKSGGHGFQCWSLQIAMSYKVWDSCVVIIMKLVIWAQEEVYSLAPLVSQFKIHAFMKVATYKFVSMPFLSP